METITVEQIIDLIMNKHGEELMKDLVLLRMMGYSKEVIDDIFKRIIYNIIVKGR